MCRSLLDVVVSLLILGNVISSRGIRTLVCLCLPEFPHSEFEILILTFKSTYFVHLLVHLSGFCQKLSLKSCIVRVSFYQKLIESLYLGTLSTSRWLIFILC